MSVGEWMPNLCAYFIQSSTLLVVGLLLPKLLSLKNPHALLTYYRALLPIVVLYPLFDWLWPSEHLPMAATEEVEYIVGVMSSVIPADSSPFSIYDIFICVVAVSCLRLVWISVGLASLRKMRRKARPLQTVTLVNAMQEWIGCRATFLLSDNTAGPATFGWANPTVLLPADFVGLPGAQQRAIVCHELLHVKRNDWLLGLVDEVIRALLWFHPAVWSLLGRIALCREQTVDLTVVKLTGERKAYLEVLKSIAVRKEPRKAMAHGFLSKSQLYQRVMLLMQECGISKLRLVCTHLVFAVGLLITGVTGAEIFPIGDYTQSFEGDVSHSELSGNLDFGSWMHAPRTQGRVLARVFGGFALDVMDRGKNLVVGQLMPGGSDQTSSLHETESGRGHTRPSSGGGGTGKLTVSKEKAGTLSSRSQTELRHFAKKFLTDTPVKKTKTAFAGDLDLIQMQMIEKPPQKKVAMRSDPNATKTQRDQTLRSHHPKSVDVGYVRADTSRTSPQGIERKYPETRADLVYKIDPEYPKDVVMEGIAGHVVFSALVNTSGSVSSVQIVETDDMRFNPPVLRAVKRWRYHPATKGGVPISSWVSGKIQFVCKEEYPGSRIMRKCRKRNEYGGYVAAFRSNPKS